MATIETTETRFTFGIRDSAGDWHTFEVDFTKLHPTWVAAHLKKAAQRYLNDKYSGEKGNDKLELIRLDLADMHKGDPMPERERKVGVAVADPVRKLARQIATTVLTDTFAKVFGKDSKAWAGEAKIAHLFKLTDAGNVRYDLAAVDAWMDGQAKAGKRDYMAEAKAQLETPVKVDLADLGF